uniref:hypothetical protein n=1 Tax=Salmonella enterica TaxID=28901 RepID=UPI0020C4624D
YRFFSVSLQPISFGKLMLSTANTSDYTALMARRIRRILLVCNNYDSFALEEDGHIDVQIAQEYAELNLSNPPAILRA